MRLLGGALIQYDQCPYENGKLGHRLRHTKREDVMKRHGEDGHLQAKERGQILPSPPSEGPNLADTLTSDFLPPELWV